MINEKMIKRYHCILVKQIFCCTLILQLFISESLAKDYIIIHSTTSLENSGLLNVIEQVFENKFEIDVRFISVGTGQAIRNAKNGDGDLLMVHSKQDEIKFVEEGYGVERFEIMYNDFIIVGPTHDPAGLRDAHDIIDAMQKLKLSKATFLSRDDNSGTHKKELFLWKLAKIKIKDHEKWYSKNGLGMGVTLNIASEMDAYTLSDRGTWLSFNNKNFLDILFEKDESLKNYYGIIAVNPKKFPFVKYEDSMIFINWLLSEDGQSTINGFKLNDQQLFFTY